jgi:pimeloyl-ACP methyl ester carboxylesterase
MGEYMELSGGRVWYDVHGDGEPLVLIHGGAVDSRHFDQLLEPLAEHFRVITTDLWGHGRTPDRDQPFSLDTFATDVSDLIERVADGSAHVLGHSYGANVAFALAMRWPDRVRKLVQVSGGFDIEADQSAGDMSIEQMVEGTVAFLGDTYGAVSPDGQEHFAVVVRKGFELSAREPRWSLEDVATVAHRTLVMVADDDITPIEHQLEFYRALPNAEMAVVPGTSHFLLQEKARLCSAIVLDFLMNDPVPTVAPMRRAQRPQNAGTA